MGSDRVPVLASPIRREILSIVEDEPGISFRALSDRVGMNANSLSYHAFRLEIEGFLVQVRAGRRLLLFPPHYLDEMDPADVVLLAEPACRRVALAIVEHPRLTVNELVELLGDSHRSVYHHVKRLRDAGLVAAADPTRHRGLVAAPRLLGIVSRFIR